MPSSNLIQLAPTLSAEERFKLIVTDLHRQMAGEKPVLSASERQAIINCENRAMWEEYTRHIGIIQWAQVFWVKDIETEKLRACASYFILSRVVDRLITAAFMNAPETLWDRHCAEVREDVEFLERNSTEFYAYREAIIQVERELYGIPLFDEKKKAVIASYYEAVDEMFSGYNVRIRALSETHLMKVRMKYIAENMESYTAKKPIPPKELIDKLVGEIMEVVDAEMQMLGR
jgi:hypothetical protein